MDSKKFNKNLLEKIKKEEIKQTPKYIFVLKNIFIWVFLIVLVILGSISLSISFDYLISADWYLLKKIWWFKIFIIFIPFFWISFLIFSSFLSYYNYRHTDNGYKLSLIKVFVINIFLSLIIALILYFTWFNNYIESKLEEYIPKYRTVLVNDKASRMIKVWQNENEGLLIWEILEVWENKLVFKDFNDKNWNIILHNNSVTEVKYRVELLIWEKIKIIWDKISEKDFNAIEIRPFSWNKNKN